MIAYDPDAPFIRGIHRLSVSVLVIALFVGLFAIFDAPRSSEATPSMEASRKLNERVLKFVDFEGFDKTMFSLCEGSSWGLVGLARNQLSWLGIPSRPGSASGNKVIFGWKGSDQTFEVDLGQEVFLDYEPKNGGLFSLVSYPTRFTLSPIKMEKSGVYLKLALKKPRPAVLNQMSGFHFFQAENGAVEGGKEDTKEVEYLTLQASPPSQTVGEVCSREAKSLLSGKLWGKDLLIEMYGGSSFDSQKMKVKLELDGSMGTQVLYVSSGDLLSCEGGKWRCVNVRDVHFDAPVARIDAFSNNGLSLELWDAGRHFPIKHTLMLQPKGEPRAKIEEMFTKIKLRTARVATARSGKKRVVIHEGDWWLSSPSGWKNLKRVEEIDACLDHRLDGELFIVEKIDKHPGRSAIYGRLFDSKHTAVKSVMIPIHLENEPIGSKKNPSVPSGYALKRKAEKRVSGPIQPIRMNPDILEIQAE